MKNISKKRASPSGGLAIAIDGPAGVGKTTTAKALAELLKLLYVDTGAMYRAVGVKADQLGISPDDREASGKLARKARVRLRLVKGELRVTIQGTDVTEEIRTDKASDYASRISVHPEVREQMVAWQREMAASEGVVMEGRDIGTVVLPDAEAKIFLTASAEERARRRHTELRGRGENPTFESVLRTIRERDARDQGRETAPLKPARDAVVLDCTALGLSAQVDAVRRVVDAMVHLGDR
jgi:cytidylate kinase